MPLEGFCGSVQLSSVVIDATVAGICAQTILLAVADVVRSR
jgi:hypothetical protein